MVFSQGCSDVKLYADFAMTLKNHHPPQKCEPSLGRADRLRQSNSGDQPLS